MNLEHKNGQVEILLENKEEIDAFSEIVYFAYDSLDLPVEAIETARILVDFLYYKDEE